MSVEKISDSLTSCNEDGEPLAFIFKPTKIRPDITARELAAARQYLRATYPEKQFEVQPVGGSLKIYQEDDQEIRFTCYIVIEI